MQVHGVIIGVDPRKARSRSRSSTPTNGFWARADSPPRSGKCRDGALCQLVAGPGLGSRGCINAGWTPSSVGFWRSAGFAVALAPQ